MGWVLRELTIWRSFFCIIARISLKLANIWPFRGWSTRSHIWLWIGSLSFSRTLALLLPASTESLDKSFRKTNLCSSSKRHQPTLKTLISSSSLLVFRELLCCILMPRRTTRRSRKALWRRDKKEKRTILKVCRGGRLRWRQHIKSWTVRKRRKKMRPKLLIKRI